MQNSFCWWQCWLWAQILYHHFLWFHLPTNVLTVHKGPLHISLVSLAPPLLCLFVLVTITLSDPYKAHLVSSFEPGLFLQLHQLQLLLWYDYIQHHARWSHLHVWTGLYTFYTGQTGRKYVKIFGRESQIFPKSADINKNTGSKYARVEVKI